MINFVGIWDQKTYRMIFSLAANDCITGVLLGIGVLTEIESVRKAIGCKIVIAGLWLCVVTSVYTFTMISVARWLMLNHPEFYKRQFGEDDSMRSAYIAIAFCWLAGACHALVSPVVTGLRVALCVVRAAGAGRQAADVVHVLLVDAIFGAGRRRRRAW